MLAEVFEDVDGRNDPVFGGVADQLVGLSGFHVWSNISIISTYYKSVYYKSTNGGDEVLAVSLKL